MRWGTLVVGVILAVLRGPLAGHILVWGMVLLATAIWWTVRSPETLARAFASGCTRRGQFPAAARAGTRSSAWIGAELLLDVVAVVSTGYWLSPFVFCLMTPLIAAGFQWGFAASIRNAAAAALAVGIPFVLTAPGSTAIQLTGQWSFELLLVALLAGYAHNLFGRVEDQQSVSISRMGELSEANTLLISLHRLAQTMPASLNLDEVLASTLTRLKSIVDCDVAAVLLRDDSRSRWVVAVGEGVRLQGSLGQEELPAPLQAATSSSVASLVVALGPDEGIGVNLLSGSGLYAPLRARGALVGLVALEHHEAGRYGRRELQLLDGFLEPAALAIDNARWFARLRAMGADQERIRIARDIHDRVGQSLAGVAFGLDSVAGRARDRRLREDLDQLRGEVRGVLTDVRDTLCDLRTDVSDERGLVDTLESFLGRVRTRGDIDVRFASSGYGRLPPVQERELWRIAHEAITNVERHACAQHLEVAWRCDGQSALLTVRDDGRGFVADVDGRVDSFGILGMRERADAIGATLDIDSGPAGTTVRCELRAA